MGLVVEPDFFFNLSHCGTNLIWINLAQNKDRLNFVNTVMNRLKW